MGHYDGRQKQKDGEQAHGKVVKRDGQLYFQQGQCVGSVYRRHVLLLRSWLRECLATLLGLQWKTRLAIGVAD